MAYTTINDPTQYFNTLLYTGNGTDDRSITGVGFQPDFLWVKNRSAANGHALVDTTRGATATLRSQVNNAEETESNGIQAFESDGFQIGTSGLVNTSSNNYVAWNWLANGGTTTTDTSGDIDTVIQANQTAGFSILTFTSNGSSNQLIPHGLGSAPEVFWVKPRSAVGSWACYFKAIQNNSGKDYYIALNSTSAASTNVIWGNTDPTNTFLTIDTDSVAGGTPTMVVYCFKEIKGYSKFGSYTGNGSTDGTFVYTGFKPSWLLYKATNTTSNWMLRDNKRTSSGGYNPNGSQLLANASDAESTNDSATVIDLVSNGFKLRNTENNDNASGNTYIYMAFAESPFVSSDGVPTTAK